MRQRNKITWHHSKWQCMGTHTPPLSLTDTEKNTVCAGLHGRLTHLFLSHTWAGWTNWNEGQNGKSEWLDWTTWVEDGVTRDCDEMLQTDGKHRIMAQGHALHASAENVYIRNNYMILLLHHFQLEQYLMCLFSKRMGLLITTKTRPHVHWLKTFLKKCKYTDVKVTGCSF